jgi:positive regulator of sigma E activity
MNMECKTGGGFITAENTEGLPIKTGQTVEVKAKRASLLRQALTAFLPPLVGFIAGYALVRFFFPQAGEGAAPGMGVIFLFAGAFFVYWKRKGKNGEMTFEVTKILGNK